MWVSLGLRESGLEKVRGKVEVRTLVGLICLGAWPGTQPSDDAEQHAYMRAVCWVARHQYTQDSVRTIVHVIVINGDVTHNTYHHGWLEVF